MRIQIHHLLLLVAVATVVSAQAAISFPLEPNQGVAFWVLGATVLGSALMFAFLLREEAKQILRHPDVLVPVLILPVAGAVIEWLAKLPLFDGAGQASAIHLGGLALSVTGSVVAYLVLGMFFVAWQTLLVIAVVREDRAPLRETLRAAWSALPRTILAVLVGWSVPLLAVVLLMPFVQSSLFVAVGAVTLLVVAWALVSEALFPIVLDRRRDIRSAFVFAFAVGWSHWRRWGVAVVAQLLLVGVITVVVAEWTETSVSPTGVTTNHYNVVRNVQANAIWPGGYPDDSKWDEAFLKVYRREGVPVVSSLLSLVLLIVAVGVKLRVVAVLSTSEAALPPPDAPARLGTSR